MGVFYFCGVLQGVQGQIGKSAAATVPDKVGGFPGSAPTQFVGNQSAGLANQMWRMFRMRYVERGREEPWRIRLRPQSVG